MAWFTVNYNNYMKEGIQNTHLAPVFNEIFPLLMAQEIKYWVYGGVAIAGVKGSFGRKNADVDVFVLEEDFKAVSQIVNSYGNQKEGTIPVTTTLGNGRPKVELKPKGGRFDWFSVVPVYFAGDKVIFKFREKSLALNMEVLTEVERKINNYSFTTPPDYYIKELFKHYLKTKRVKDKNKVDAEDFLDTGDLHEIFRQADSQPREEE